jgi:hypothetical protein
MSPPYDKNEVFIDVSKTLMLYGDLDCNSMYARYIEQVLSNHLKRKIMTRVEGFDNVKGRWIYSAWMDEGGLLEPIEVSENVRRCLRRLVTNAYKNRKDLIPFDDKLKNGGSDVIERQFIERGGMAAYTFYVDIPSFSDIQEVQQAIAHYWIVRGWAEAATILDNTVRPPVLNPDNTVTIYVRDFNHIHGFIRLIKKWLSSNRKTKVDYAYLDTTKKMVIFRAQGGFPVIINGIGVKLPSKKLNSSEIKNLYLDWLYPCIGDEDLSWDEFGRIIKDNGDCYALEETPENSTRITFMRVARGLSVAGIYPLGPFSGLMPWPYKPPDVVEDFKILGYDQTKMLEL